MVADCPTGPTPGLDFRLSAKLTRHARKLYLKLLSTEPVRPDLLRDSDVSDGPLYLVRPAETLAPDALFRIKPLDCELRESVDRRVRRGPSEPSTPTGREPRSSAMLMKRRNPWSCPGSVDT